ncbi:MAG: crossover junction endodeoxyribonuclease RuvC, partial [Armatimonadota bacterium]|nr:crossover junction endodeoxyribonuclease RuvC [Armatimonadota bacterium]
MPPRTQPFPLSDSNSSARNGSTLRRVQRLHDLPVAHRILGIDPGLHRTGYGLIERRKDEGGRRNGRSSAQHSALSIQEWVVVEAGVLKAKANDPLPERLQALYAALCEVLREHQPDIVVVEELFSTYKHPRSALLMALARGVLLLAAQQA